MPSTRAAVIVLLATAATVDFVTGPEITAAAFYIFPVTLAGWRLGRRWGFATAAVAALLNVVTDHLWPEHPLSTQVLIINEALRAAVFMTLAAFSSLLGRQQRSLAQQRDQLAADRDQIAAQRTEVTALHRRLEEDLQAARILQQVLTGSPPTHPAAEIHSSLQAARILGGDTLHLSLGPEEQLAIALADVSGKGSPAALAGAVLVGLLEDAPDRYGSSARLLRYLNDRLESRLPEEMFVTLFYGVLDLRTGTLTYASGAHEPPVLLRAEGQVEKLEAGGFPLGVFPHAEYEGFAVELRPGDAIFCYTDGLTDQVRADGTRIGEEGLHELLAENAQLPCADLLPLTLQRAAGGSTTLGDDVTVVAVRFLGTPVRQQEEALAVLDRAEIA